MNYAIEMLEKIRDGEKSLWDSHAERLAYGGEKESTLHAYEVRTQRLLELEEALSVLRGKPWSAKDKANYLISLSNETHQKRKEYIESITNSSAYKILKNVFQEDSTTEEDES